jgi:4-hydroxybenzoate polyprenyltransferase
MAITISWHYLWIYCLIAFGLWLYSRYLKRMPLIGNLAISLFCAAAVLITCIPEYAGETLSAQMYFLTGFAFFITWIREITKDLEDMEGDRRAGHRTLPVFAGTLAARILAFVLIALSITVLAILWQPLQILRGPAALTFLTITEILLIISALLLILRAREKKDFHQISAILKFSMLSGTLCLIF